MVGLNDLINMHDYITLRSCVLVGKYGGRYVVDASLYLLDIETFIFNKNI
jgi:hypothetical protein